MIVITNFVAHGIDHDRYAIRPVYYETGKAPLLGNSVAVCESRQDADLICSALNDYMVKGQADA